MSNICAGCSLIKEECICEININDMDALVEYPLIDEVKNITLVDDWDDSSIGQGGV